ncbi:hypothetical protein SAMN05421538_102215 [Paracoccus isoporae]|uniref:Uncharacterized protein n=1 Tax=Paracoccus isoporae TaxID=591205 RepID=A0A1G6WT90_9RHOB|nr:hypothetical protein [Paracoccus isoporae]SDD69024.1 hypothetical protein SAMN05421538_102215 [Paracoccus isoporae]
MNLNGLINMVLRRLTHRATDYGINKGADYLARRGKKTADMTDLERQQAAKSSKGTRDMVKRARQAARITRRMR